MYGEVEEAVSESKCYDCRTRRKDKPYIYID